MKKIFLIILALTFMTSCSKKVIEVKSPCVSAKDGPCGPRVPVNDWWLKKSQA